MNATVTSSRLTNSSNGFYLAWVASFYVGREAPQFRNAKLSLELALKADQLAQSKSPTVSEVLAEAYFANDEYEKAIQLESKLAAEHSDSSLYLNNLAYWLATVPKPELRDPARALDLAKKAVALSSEAPSVLDTLAEAYFVNGDIAQAIEWEQKAIAFDPANELLRQHLARYQQGLK